MDRITSIFVAANPASTDRLRLDEEIRAITQKIRASEHRDILKLVSIWAARPDDLLQALNERKPHIVHFSGHGSLAGEIILVDSAGKPKAVSTKTMKGLFTALKDNIRVVILNACYSRPQALAITEVIDCAIGMNTTIGDQAATIFAASFYRAIGFGRSIQQAFEQGKIALQLEGVPEENTPELLVRKGIDPSQIFLTPADSMADSREGAASLSQANLVEKGAFELEGVLHVLKDRILRRTVGQLDPSVRRYDTMRAVEEGCKALASKIKRDNFIPDIVIGWKDQEREYRGSETVADRLSRELGVPFRVILMRETDERRQVVEDCRWFKEVSSALITDDACYSGSTLRSIQNKLNEINPNAENRFAVLSTMNPKKLPNLYYVSIHSSEELLFPWGWSRLIVGFYDIYKLFGISDRHTVWRENTEWGAMDTLVRGFIGNVRLLTIEPAKEMRQGPKRRFDVFLYFVGGSADVRIDSQTGTFNRDEYLFVPRSIGYSIIARDVVKILELSSGSS